MIILIESVASITRPLVNLDGIYRGDPRLTIIVVNRRQRYTSHVDDTGMSRESGLGTHVTEERVR